MIEAKEETNNTDVDDDKTFGSKHFLKDGLIVVISHFEEPVSFKRTNIIRIKH